MSSSNSSRYHIASLPSWVNEQVATPSMAFLKNDSDAMKAVEILYEDTIRKHRIEQQYGIKATEPMRLIRILCERVIAQFRCPGGPAALTTMNVAISLVHDLKEFSWYKVDKVIGYACESAIINAFWRYVPIDGFMDTPAKLLKEWNNFEHERSHWWRARKAVETDDHIRQKWEALLLDIGHLLNFHNALLHTKRLLEKPTLKHTLHLAALTAEGRTYENGQGRSISSECRHIIVRKYCDIPIKQRPERRPDAGGSKAKGAKRQRKQAYDTVSEFEDQYSYPSAYSKKKGKNYHPTHPSFYAAPMSETTIADEEGVQLLMGIHRSNTDSAELTQALTYNNGNMSKPALGRRESAQRYHEVLSRIDTSENINENNIDDIDGELCKPMGEWDSVRAAKSAVNTTSSDLPLLSHTDSGSWRTKNENPAADADADANAKAAPEPEPEPMMLRQGSGDWYKTLAMKKGQPPIYELNEFPEESMKKE
jgi:hypothetical protein